jgi:hypothetical protein
VGDYRGTFVVEEALIVWLKWSFQWVRENCGSETSAVQVSSRCELQEYICEVETLCMLSRSGIGSVWFRETCIVPVMRSVARTRLVETGNPSACAMVNCRSV